MTETKKFDCPTPRQRSKDEMTRQFLEQSIRTLGYKLRKACDKNDQCEIEKNFDTLKKARRLLSNMQTNPLTF